MTKSPDKKLSWPKRLEIGYKLLKSLPDVQDKPKGISIRELMDKMSGDFANTDAAKKQLQRFLSAYLEEDFGVIVDAVNGNKGWAITGASNKTLQENILGAASMLLISRQLQEHYSSLEDVLHVDKAVCDGSEHLPKFVQAITERQTVALNFQEYDKPEPSKHMLQPYALRQYKGRWYAIGYDETSKDFDRYDLHRCQGVQILEGKDHKFIRNPDYTIDALYGDHTFGIIINREIQGTPEEREPQKIVFRAYGRQPFYLKSCPIHPTQQLEEENQDGVTFSLQVGFTHDLQMELLSYGPNVEVISPACARERMKRALEEAVGRY